MRKRSAVGRSVLASYGAVIAAALAACSNPATKPLDLMPMPAAYESAPAPFGEAGAHEGSAVLEMLYATNRAPAVASDEAHYGGERGGACCASAPRRSPSGNRIWTGPGHAKSRC